MFKPFQGFRSLFIFPKNRFTFSSSLILQLMEPVTLTARQREVLLLLACGMTEAQIADKLHISEHTVHTHHKNINKAMKAHCLIELIGKALYYQCFTLQDWFCALASNSLL